MKLSIDIILNLVKNIIDQFQFLTNVRMTNGTMKVAHRPVKLTQNLNQLMRTKSFAVYFGRA